MDEAGFTTQVVATLVADRQQQVDHNQLVAFGGKLDVTLDELGNQAQEKEKDKRPQKILLGGDRDLVKQDSGTRVFQWVNEGEDCLLGRFAFPAGENLGNRSPENLFSCSVKSVTLLE